MKIIDNTWFNGTIGIVIVESEATKERKAYIGVGEGHDENRDIQSIANHGTPVLVETLKRLVEKMEGK